MRWGLNFATLQSFRKWDNLMDKLQIWVIGMVNIRGGWNFLKMAVMGGIENFDYKWGRGARNGEGGGWKPVKVSLHSWQRGANPPILWRFTLYCLPPLFQILYTNIYLHHLLYAHSNYLYYIKMIKWIILRYQKFTFHDVFLSFKKLFTCKSHVSVD